jgi:hypothetical protein
MKKIAFILSLILMISLLSCERDDYKTEIFNDTFKIIYGEWKHSSSNFMYIIHKSDTLCFKKLIIKPIGKFETYTNEGLFNDGKIIIETQTIDRLMVKFDPPRFFGDNKYYIHFQSYDTLHMDCYSIDCFCCNFLFTRIK